jgi:ABC-type multidrug transport system ATPase subunit
MIQWKKQKKIFSIWVVTSQSLSKGSFENQQILSVGFIQPEPFANLDPGSQLWLKNKLREMNQNGVTILILSHDLKHVTDICSRILLLDKGEIINDIQTHKNSLQELEAHFKVGWRRDYIQNKET